MSKSVASESRDHNERRKMSGKRGAEDDENEDEEEVLVVRPAESLPISTTVSTVPAVVDEFMFTESFMIHFVEYVPGDTLMRLRLATKGYRDAANALIDRGVKSGKILVHDGKDIGWRVAGARDDRRELVTRVIFLLNIKKVGERTCKYVSNLVVVDIPDGVKSIGHAAFNACSSLTTVSFPTTLTSIGQTTFAGCSSLDNVDLLHTNLQELGWEAFAGCSELKSMTIPD